MAWRTQRRAIGAARWRSVPSWPQVWPGFWLMLGLVIAVMAVGMCGLFTVELPKWVYTITPSQKNYPGSFGFGMQRSLSEMDYPYG